MSSTCSACKRVHCLAHRFAGDHACAPQAVSWLPRPKAAAPQKAADVLRETAHRRAGQTGAAAGRAPAAKAASGGGSGGACALA
jgi:hypothetical protein